jgi:hypothetical protein
MQSVALDYHTTHHLTHTAVTRLASYWTVRLQYLLLTVFSFKSLSVYNPSYLSPTVLEQACQTCGPLQAHLRPAQRIL